MGLLASACIHSSASSPCPSWPVPGLGSDAAQRPRRGEVASLGRALLPYPLKDGKHLKYQDLLNAEVFFELKMGGRELKTKLMQLNAQMAMCVQLEPLGEGIEK